MTEATPEPATTLFTAADLTAALQGPVSGAQATFAEKVVWGWLQPIVGGTDRPDPVPPQLWSYAVELGAIAAVNLTGMTEYRLGPETAKWDLGNRFAILDKVADLYADQAAGGDSMAPTGSFPEPQAWPDPIEPVRRTWW